MTDTTTRTIIYMGRTLDGKKIYHRWRDGEDVKHFAKMPGLVVGGIYTAEFSNEGNTAHPGTLTFTGSKHDDAEQVAAWELADRHTRSTDERRKAEARLARDSELDRVLQPILDFAAGLRTRNDLSALDYLVRDRLAEAYWKGKS